VLVLENPDRFEIGLTEQISCIGLLRSRSPNAARTSTTTRTRTIPNFGIWVKMATTRCRSPTLPFPSLLAGFPGSVPDHRDKSAPVLSPESSIDFRGPF
jgi:hypothetical protein